MSGIHSPQLLSDLYRDLRDRRLLPLVIVLAVGLAVVPIALSSNPEAAPAPPVPEPSAVATKSNLPTGQIVTADPGVRVYERRLGDDDKDPFVQLFTTPSPEPGAATTGGAAPVTAPVPATSGTTGSTAGTTVSSPQTPSTPSGGSTPASDDQTDVNRLLSFQLEVKSGPSGETLQSRDHVDPFTVLPSVQIPALTYLGVSLDSSLNAKKAFFLVANGVSELSGEANCVSGDPCQLITLEPGQTVQLVWLNGISYTVRLTGFNLKVRDRPESKKNSGSGKAGRQRAEDGSPRLTLGG